MTEFYDSVTPGNIPAGSYACLYFDGDYKASAEDAKRFKATRWITVLGDYRNCGIADFESGNAVYDGANLRTWAEGRRSMNCRARIYCSRANLPRAVSLTSDLPNTVYWLATLDGDQLAPNWTPRLWAVQYAGGPKAAYDTSVLYGAW